jgi:glycosyltransferase involved in cell wall biosynthesis
MAKIQAMINRPLISVVLTVFNGEETVGKCVASVLGQTFKPLELIVINDGSTDDTQAVLKSFNDERLHLYQQPNTGIWASRNRAIAMAQADWIANIDADDTWDPEKLAEQWHYLQDHPATVLLGTFTKIYDHHGHWLYDEKKLTDHKDLTAALLRGNQFTNSSVLFSKRAFDDVGGYPGKLRSGFEDYLLFVKLSRAGQIANLPKFLVHYHVSHTSVTLRHEAAVFTTLKIQCIEKGEISDQDAQRLTAMAASQRESLRKRKAGYHFFCGRAFLFYNFQRVQARNHLFKAVFFNPLWLKSWVYLGFALGVPQNLIDLFYQRRFGQMEFVK